MRNILSYAQNSYYSVFKPKKLKLQIEAALQELGPKKFSVAFNLSQMNIKGLKSCPERCPVARYLNSLGIHFVAVTMDGVKWGQNLVCNVPMPVYEFILEFDSGAYPLLQQSTLI